MHTTYTYTHGGGGGGKEKKSLKNTKINYTKDLLRHRLLIFWEDFARFFVCAASLSPSKVCHSFSTNLFLCCSFYVHFASVTSPRLGVKSAQWWHYQETGVQYDDCTDLVVDVKQICTEQKKKGKSDVLCLWGQVLYSFPYRFFPLI